MRGWRDNPSLARSLWLLLTLVVAMAAVACVGSALAGGQSAAPPVLIDSVLFDGYAYDDADEAVRLVNVSAAPVDLSGWTLSDGTTTAAIPAGTALAAGSGLWLARDVAAFTLQFGHPPDLVLSPWPGFSNTGDEVVLRDAVGGHVDALVYQTGPHAITLAHARSRTCNRIQHEL